MMWARKRDIDLQAVADDAVEVAQGYLDRAEFYHKEASDVAERLRSIRERNNLAAAIEYQFSGAPEMKGAK